MALGFNFSKTLTPDLREKMDNIRDRLSYVPNGVQSKVAKIVKCTRQTVHNVVHVYTDEDYIKSDYAYFVWRELEKILWKPEYTEDYENFNRIYSTLMSEGKVNVEIGANKFRLLKRKFDKKGFKYKLTIHKGWPNSYIFELIQPQPC